MTEVYTSVKQKIQTLVRQHQEIKEKVLSIKKQVDSLEKERRKYSLKSFIHVKLTRQLSKLKDEMYNLLDKTSSVRRRINEILDEELRERQVERTLGIVSRLSTTFIISDIFYSIEDFQHYYDAISFRKVENARELKKKYEKYITSPCIRIYCRYFYPRTEERLVTFLRIIKEIFEEIDIPIIIQVDSRPGHCLVNVEYLKKYGDVVKDLDYLIYTTTKQLKI